MKMQRSKKYLEKRTLFSVTFASSSYGWEGWSKRGFHPGREGVNDQLPLIKKKKISNYSRNTSQHKNSQGISLKSLSMLQCLSPHCRSLLGGWKGCCGSSCCRSCGVSVVARCFTTAHNPKHTHMHQETIAASWTAKPGKRTKRCAERWEGMKGISEDKSQKDMFWQNVLTMIF